MAKPTLGLLFTWEFQHLDHQISIHSFQTQKHLWMGRISVNVVFSTIPSQVRRRASVRNAFRFHSIQWYIDLIRSGDKNKLLSYSFTDAAPVS